MPSLRDLAAEVIGRAALEERFEPAASLCSVDRVLLAKLGSADPELLRVAATIDKNDVLNVYEALGGEYSSKARE